MPNVDLTPRELEVVKLLTQGMSNRSIAECLSFSQHTAKFHVASIAKKLGVKTRIEVALLAVRAGLV